MIGGSPFSTKAAYAALHHSESESVTNNIWSSRIPSKVKVFGWLVQLDRLNTRANQLHKNIIDSSACPRCQAVPEDCLHLFFTCPAAQAIWQQAKIHLSLSCFNDLWEHRSANLPSASVWPLMALLLLWKIWDTRNALVFRGEHRTASATIKLVIEDLSLAT
jgi:hypothetical protein